MTVRLASRTALVIALAGAMTPAAAQPLGTFRWQLQPYCNVVAVVVTPTGGGYRLEGTDDQCGAPQRASAVGTAFVNPDGSIGLGFTVVTAPGGAPVTVDAAISLSTLSGTWRDGLGHSGAFVFTPGAGTAGTPRPAAPVGPPLTTAVIGTGLSGTVANGALNLTVQFAGSGTAPAVARADHMHGVPPSGNTALGDGALAAQRALAAGPSGNTAVGSDALKANTAGFNNTALGASALVGNESGAQNVAIGHGAMRQNVDGHSNVAIGWEALGGRGSNNVAIGFAALRSATTGSANVAIGANALQHVTTGSGNVAIGVGAGTLAGAGQAGNLFIGSTGQAGDNFTIRIGEPFHEAVFITGISGQITTSDVPVLINAAGKLGTLTSSARFKQDIQPLTGAERDRVLGLRPVQFTYRPEFGGDGEVQYGLLAEEVAATFPELVARDGLGQPWAVRYQLLPPLLLQAAQDLEARRRALDERLSQLDARLAALEGAGRVGKAPR